MEPEQNYTLQLLQLLQERINFLSKEVQEVQLDLKEGEDFKRAFSSIQGLQAESKALEQRIDSLEREQPMGKLVQKWVLAAVWTAASAAVLFAAKFMGFM